MNTLVVYMISKKQKHLIPFIDAKLKFEELFEVYKLKARKPTILKTLPEMIMKSYAQLTHLTFLS